MNQMASEGTTAAALPLYDVPSFDAILVHVSLLLDEDSLPAA
jgi:hypothetical protein